MIVAVLFDPATATPITPKLAEVTSTLASTAEWSWASTVRSPARLRSLPCTKARVCEVMVELVPAPPPDRLRPRLTLTEIAAARAAAEMRADSSAKTVRPPAAPSTVALLTKASTTLAMVLLATATPIAAEPPNRPTVPATDAASVLAAISEVSSACTRIASPMSRWLPRVPFT